MIKDGGRLNRGQTSTFHRFRNSLTIHNSRATVNTRQVANVYLLIHFHGDNTGNRTTQVIILSRNSNGLKDGVPCNAPDDVDVGVIIMTRQLTARLFNVHRAVLIRQVRVRHNLLIKVLAMARRINAIPDADRYNQRLNLVRFQLIFNN